MPASAIVVQQPQKPAQLVLLFHGVGAQAASMQPLAQRIAAAFPQGMVVCINAAHPSDFPGGFQWFSVVGITEDNRQARVNQAMAAFVDCIHHWQTQAGLGPEATALVGFSQGAIMALESTKLVASDDAQRSVAPAGRVVALAGRYATLPESPVYRGTVHLLHGKNDAVMSYEQTVLAAHRLRALDIDFTAEVRPGIGHEVHPEFADALVERLQSHISHHLMSEGVRGATVASPDSPEAP